MEAMSFLVKKRIILWLLPPTQMGCYCSNPLSSPKYSTCFVVEFAPLLGLGAFSEVLRKGMVMVALWLVSPALFV